MVCSVHDSRRGLHSTQISKESRRLGSVGPLCCNLSCMVSMLIISSLMGIVFTKDTFSLVLFRVVYFIRVAWVGASARSMSV